MYLIQSKYLHPQETSIIQYLSTKLWYKQVVSRFFDMFHIDSFKWYEDRRSKRWQEMWQEISIAGASFARLFKLGLVSRDHVLFYDILSVYMYLHIYAPRSRTTSNANNVPRLFAFSVYSYSTSVRWWTVDRTIFARYLFRGTSEHELVKIRSPRTLSAHSMYTCQPGSKRCDDITSRIHIYTVCHLVLRKWGSLTTARGTLL